MPNGKPKTPFVFSLRHLFAATAGVCLAAFLLHFLLRTPELCIPIGVVGFFIWIIVALQAHETTSEAAEPKPAGILPFVPIIMLGILRLIYYLSAQLEIPP